MSKKKESWEVVDQAVVAGATKVRNEKREKAEAAVEALRQLKAGEAVRITFPEDKRFRADALRCWWRSKMQIASKKEGVSKAFVSITSSDGKFLFIQRNPELV